MTTSVSIKKQKTTVESAELSKDHIDLDNVAKQIVLKKWLLNCSDLLLKEKAIMLVLPILNM